VIGLIAGCLVHVVVVMGDVLVSLVILANNIFLLEDGRTTETCSSISSKINLRY
jgi:hypothetical protein